MSRDYIIKIKAGETEAYRIGNSRVSLDSVVYSWLQGDSPETIADNFPVLTLEEVYGAITFYLANQAEVDEYLRQSEAQYQAMRQQNIEELRRTRPELYQKLRARKKQPASPDSELVNQ